MKVTYTNLNSYFAGSLPAPSVVADALTFHAWEIESVEEIESETVFDVKVLPDKSSWGLSAMGIAKDLSVILDLPLSNNFLAQKPNLSFKTDAVKVSIESDTCTRYMSALITGVRIGPSPAWLISELQALGQRSINNVVDSTNFVMFNLGQPLHAFDAKKLKGDSVKAIVVRNAKESESITTLTGESYVVSHADTVIADGVNNAPIGIAGIKGGKYAEVDTETVDIILESANFTSVATRLTAQRLKLRTDASSRFENGISSHMTSYALAQATTLILETTGGVLNGYTDTGEVEDVQKPVSVSVSKINSVLGLALTRADVEAIIKRFGYEYVLSEDTITVTPPFYRTDIVIAEDIIEEIGRMYGYEHVVAIPIKPIALREINVRFYYAEKIREILFGLGFSEILTSSFRDNDEVKLINALASDKGYLRSALYKNLEEAMQKNAGNVELFGVEKVRIFEIGTVFNNKGEIQNLALGVSSKAGVTPKDNKELKSVLETMTQLLGLQTIVHTYYEKEGVIEINLTELIKNLNQPTAYTSTEKSPDVTYKQFSNYPHVVRDIAFWTPIETAQKDAQCIIETQAGSLAVRIDCFDRFEKEERVSYGFRIVFQSYEKTLTAEEVDAVMHTVYSAISDRGWVVR